MSQLIEIKKEKFDLLPGQKVLKAHDYMGYLVAIDLVKAARDKGEAIIEEAQAVYEAEKERGYQNGIEQGLEQNAHKIQETVAKCNRYYLTCEQVITRVVMDAVRCILPAFDQVEMTLSIVKEALKNVSKEKQIHLHVHPECVQSVKEKIDTILSEFTEIGYLEVVEDTRLQQGGCLLVTEIGTIDASVDSQLNALNKAIDEQFSDHRKTEPLSLHE